jgi:hypothetical protein
VPTDEYLCEGLCVEEVGVPSPKSHEYVNGIVPPEADPLKYTVSGADPLVGLAPAVAVSGAPPTSEMLTVEVATQLWPSVT